VVAIMQDMQKIFCFHRMDDESKTNLELMDPNR